MVINHRKRRKRYVVRELFYVVTCIKPGVDAYRVINKAPAPVGTIMTPHDEMLYLRGVKLITECIPGCLIQAIAYINTEQTTVATLSLASSILTAAFISASTSIEKDINRESRINFPKFYGFLPLDSLGRGATVAFLVFTLSCSQLAAKVFACALCTVESVSLLFAYFGFDLFVLLVYKIIRDDLIYWVPIKSISLTILSSTIIRTMFKFALDFTGILLSRHPYELGGAYFTFTMISTPLACVYLGYRYLALYDDEKGSVSGRKGDGDGDGDRVFSSSQVYGCIGGLVVMQMTSFGLLLKLMNPAHRRTFTSFRTAREHVVLTFRNAPPGRIKVGVMNNHRSLWRSIEGEVRGWLNSELKGWLEEIPDWFDARVRGMILDDMVDDPEVLKLLRMPLKEDEADVTEQV